MRQKFAKLVKDDTPMVRWGAAQAMAVICHALDQEMITEFLLPLLKELLQDKNDSVKVHAVQSSVVVCELIADADVIHQSIVPSLKQAFQNKQSWRLRFAVAENAAKIGQRLRKAHVDTSILPFYVTLLGDSEPEVRSESVNKLADLAVNCTTSLIVQTLLPKLKLQLATESSQHVKGSMAFSICKLAERVSPDEAGQHLIPMISILLKNNSTEVIVSLIENLEPLIRVLPDGPVNEKLIPALINLAQDKTWRIRLAAVQFFPKLAQFVDRETFQTKIEPTLLGMVIDPVYMIREESANTIIKLGQSLFDAEWLERIAETKLEELVRHERFMLRIQTIHMINQMKGHLQSQAILRVFAQHLLTLAVDPVPNIRFNCSKCIGSFYPSFAAED